jgi:hypothetical protein
VPVSAHGSASDRNCAWAFTIRLTMPKQVEGAAGHAVNPSHRHHVAGEKPVEHAKKFGSVGPRAVTFSR